MDERSRIRLTKYSTKAGWASKFAPGDLEQALRGLAPGSVEGFVSGIETRDDAGDALVLTKPLGILTTALKRDIVSEEEIEAAVQTASLLNKPARDAIREVGVSAATDVTGYGFLGHLTEMLDAGAVGAVVHRDEIPVWERAVLLANAGVYPGGLESNREYLEGLVKWDGVGEGDLLPLYDPQTSGGLLVAVPEGRSSALVRVLEKRCVPGAIVGEVLEQPGVRVTR